MSEITEIEKSIIQSAKQIFIEKGFEKAKMQEIADRAGISRTNLNYYYRTKENLFYSIVDQIFESLLPRFETMIENPQADVENQLIAITDIYIGFIRKNSELPYFIISEINRNPKLLVGFIKNSHQINSYIAVLRALLASALKPEQVNQFFEMPLEEIITLFYGLLFMPYIVTPMVKELYGGDEKKINDYYDNHGENVKFILKKILKD